jgi:hypothetical protein
MERIRSNVSMLALLAALVLTVMAGCAADDVEGNNNVSDHTLSDAGRDAIEDDDDASGTLDAGDEDTGHEDAGDQDAVDEDAGNDDAGDEDADNNATDADDSDATNGSDGGDETDAGDGDAADGGVDATDGGDTPDATPIPTGCKNKALTGTTFPLAPAGTLGQLYVRAAFDGSGVWVAYAAREAAGSGNEDIFALRVLCDGTIGAGPMRVTSTPVGIRDYYPSVDVRDGTVYIVWTSEDESTGVKTVQYRTYRIDGAPLMTASVDVTPVDSTGAPISEMIWETDIAGLPGGGAAIVASYAPQATDYSMQIVVQKVDDFGNLVGPAIDAYSTMEAKQFKPSIAAETANKVWVSWANQSPPTFMSPTTVVYRSLNLLNPQQVAPTPVGTAASPYLTHSATGPSPFAEPIRDPSQVFLAHMTDSYDIRLVNAGAATHQATATGATGGLNFYPSVATEPGGGALAWFKANPSPIAGEILVQPFSYTASGLTTGTAMSVPLYNSANAARSPYGPAIVNVGGDLYFVAWPEGPAAGEAQVMGRFIQP